ncbi:MAG TPA: 6,7-dimethyl-8-ribityllumazine synthase [bacterium]|nr:6,7-dimethyl-8-ribityllumazine synthase [Myxococcales bacterium]OQA59229.1 MAG: 6,7-dimethyl-8-ribityllumazine synthase [bacterium ADurb.Bin270]HPW46173.1 6,7-dimethyl-8-ribityllumazine synthase [bacterium]
MPKIIEGGLSSKGLRMAVVVSRFNDFITSRLVDGAMDVISRSGGDLENAVLVKVPGAMEISLAAKKLAESGKYDAVICLGAIIRGSTPHFEHVANQSARGLAQTMLSSGIPISFGVITADNLEQAIERAGTKQGNKGSEAALAAIEMANVLRNIG